MKLPLVHCVLDHMDVGHVGKCGGAKRARTLQQESQESKEHKSKSLRKQTLLFRSLNISNLPTFAIPTPTLGNDLFPSVTDRKVTSLLHSDLTEHTTIFDLSFATYQLFITRLNYNGIK